MRISTFAAAIITLTFGCSNRSPAEDKQGQAQEAASLRQVQTIELPGVEGRFDHFAIDLPNKRLFLAALGNNSLEVIDLANNTRLQSLPNLKKPTGAAYIPDLNRLAVASGDDGLCRFYDGNPLKLVGQIKDLDDADNVRYDPVAKKLYVGYSNGALAVIDPQKMQKISDIKLNAHPESFQLEKTGPRIFVNLPDAHQVAVVDRDKNSVIAKWPLKDPSANFPMALDEPHKRIFIGCRSPARLLVLDTDSGKVIANIPCVGDTDDLFYDAAQSRIYISGGEGAINVIHQRDPDHYESLGTQKTAPGARTSFFSPDLHSLYLAIPHRGAQPAQVRIYSTK
jgi:DNA-binding beta-propeller fold protein YncE